MTANRPLFNLHCSSKQEILADLDGFPILSFIRPAARLGWWPDLWENFMGSETDPLSFETASDVKQHANEHNGGLDDETTEGLLRHWQAAIKQDWLQRHEVT